MVSSVRGEAVVAVCDDADGGLAVDNVDIPWLDIASLEAKVCDGVSCAGGWLRRRLWRRLWRRFRLRLANANEGVHERCGKGVDPAVQVAELANRADGTEDETDTFRGLVTGLSASLAARYTGA